MRAPELLRVSEHLGECEVCRRGVESTMNADVKFFALRSEIFGEDEQIASHVTSEQIADYVDKDLSGEALKIVTDHLTQCEECNLAADDLLAFRNQIAPSIEREYLPAAKPSPTQSWWHRTLGFLPDSFRRSPIPVAVMAILLVAMAGWLFLRTTKEREPKQEVAVLPTPSSQAPSPSPNVQNEASQPSSAPVVAQVKDGQRVLTLDREGKLSGADDLPVAYQNSLKKALTTQRIERSSQLNDLFRPQSSLMSSEKTNGEFSVIEPVGNVVLESRPTFRWSPMKDATSYVVEVYDSEFKLVTTSVPVNSHSWKASVSLSRDRLYSWQVKAMKDGQEVISPLPPAPQAKFRVLDQVKVNQLAVARRAYATSHLTLGILYAEAGLLKESEQEFRLLLKENPDSEVARNLLRQIQALQRRSE